MSELLESLAGPEVKSVFTLWYQNTGKKGVLKYCRWRLRR